MNEEWRDIKGYEGLYQVSNLGRVKSLRYNHSENEKILKGFLSNRGYHRVSFYKDGVRKDYSVHRLVAEAFIPNTDNKPCIDHIDTNKLNNKVDNLRWCTNKENNWNELTRNKRSDTMKKLYEEGSVVLPKPKSGSEHPDSIKVVQLTLEGDFVCVWDSMGRTVEGGFDYKHVCGCCRGKRKTHKGFKWMYLSDYEKMIK